MGKTELTYIRNVNENVDILNSCKFSSHSEVKPGKEGKETNKILVKNIPFEASLKDLKQLFGYLFYQLILSINVLIFQAVIFPQVDIFEWLSLFNFQKLLGIHKH